MPAPAVPREPAERLLLYGLYPLMLLAAVFFCTVRPIGDPDCWFHMAFGRYVLQNHAIPYEDIYSFTAGRSEWISSGWLSSVILHALFQGVGETDSGTGVILMVLFVVAASVLAIYFTAVRVYGNRGSVALVLVAAILASYLRYNPRPDIWSPLFAAVVCLLIVTAETPLSGSGARRVPRRLWLLPLLFAAWPNFHAGFIAGLMVLVLYGAWLADKFVRTRERVRLAMLVPCVACFATWMLNPYGPGIVRLAAKIKAIPGFNMNIFEWMPMIWYSGYNMTWATYAGVFLLLALCGWALIAGGRSVPWWHWAVTLLFTAFAFHQRRQAGLMAVVLPVMALPHLGALDRVLARRRAVIAPLVVAACLCVCGLKWAGKMQLGGGPPRVGRVASFLPCFVTDWLRDNRPPANMFNTYGIGGYLIYYLAPETRVLIDGRLDLYPVPVWEDYLAVDEARMPLDDFTAKYGINSFVIHIRDAKDDRRHLAYRLTEHPDWRLVYFDDYYAAFVRETAATREYLRTRAFRHASPWATDRLVAAARNPAMAGTVRKEIERAMEFTAPVPNATAVALAALDTFLHNQPEEARQLLGFALKNDPRNHLARRMADTKPGGGN